MRHGPGNSERFAARAPSQASTPGAPERPDRRTVWQLGEEAASRYLTGRGFAVLERNYRHGRDEIDIVARRGRLIVFCEVKARTAVRYGAPEEAVDYRKVACVRRCASAWLAARRPGGVEVRFDVISVVLRGGRAHVTHIEAAF